MKRRQSAFKYTNFERAIERHWAAHKSMCLHRSRDTDRAQSRVTMTRWSCILRTEATSVLLEGDAESPIEQGMLAEDGLESTLLKVGHHGSTTSTRPEFLEQVAPRWAVISCGLRNRYGHPREEILSELQASHVRTFSTDINGATCFELDGKDVRAIALCGVATK